MASASSPLGTVTVFINSITFKKPRFQQTLPVLAQLLYQHIITCLRCIINFYTNKSFRDIVLKKVIYIKSTVSIKKQFTKNSTMGYILEYPVGKTIVAHMMKFMPLRALTLFTGGEINDNIISDEKVSENLS